MSEQLERWLGVTTAANAGENSPKTAATHENPWRSCALYVRPEDDMIFVFAQGRDADAGWGVTHALAGSISASAGAGAVGQLALQAIDQYQVIPKSLADVARTAAPAAAGYRSWTALERTTRHLSIDSDGRTVRAMPYRACPEGGMTGAVHPPPQCGRDAASVGALILGTLRQMPPPPGVKPPRAPKSASSAAAAASARVDDAGDVPETFGYKIEWLAIGTTDHQAVADALEPVDVRPCGWSEGVERAYRDRGALFISPAVGGWTLAVGWMMQGRLSELLPLLEQLSARFGEAQYFGNHRVSDYYAWAKAEDGRIVRAFESGNGEISIDHGPRTAEEESLGLRFTGVEDDSNDLWPGEEHVMLIAGEWSLNPQHLDAYESRGQGPLGRRRRREA